MEKINRAFVLEGPTDLAAALTMGLYAVGRPSCSGGMGEVCTVFKKYDVNEAVIIADNDDPGLRGALMLQGHLPMKSVIVVLPCKDLREFLSIGGERSDLEEIVSQLVWHPAKDSQPS